MVIGKPKKKVYLSLVAVAYNYWVCYQHNNMKLYRRDTLQFQYHHIQRSVKSMLNSNGLKIELCGTLYSILFLFDITVTCFKFNTLSSI